MLCEGKMLPGCQVLGLEYLLCFFTLSLPKAVLAIADCLTPFLFLDGDGRRLKGAIQRSTETGLAVEMPSRTVRQASHESIEDSMNSYGSEGK